MKNLSLSNDWELLRVIEDLANEENYSDEIFENFENFGLKLYDEDEICYEN